MRQYWKKEPVECLISQCEINRLVKGLALRISDDYRDRVRLDNPLLMVGILKGAVIFLSDLVRQMDIPTSLDFMAVSSYGASTTSSGVVRILHDLDASIEGRHVMVVEDIVDTGLTLQYLKNHLASRGPRSLRVCVLLDKPERRQALVDVDYCGQEIPDKFVVGYGLDYDEKYRDLPHVAVVRDDEGGEKSET